MKARQTSGVMEAPKVSDESIAPPMLPSELKLRSEVQWRGYEDGVVVYVPETCETHILPVDFLGMLVTPQRVLVVEQDGVIEKLYNTSDGVLETRVSRSFVEELTDLKIFDRLN